jgi:hypothetical protein
LHTDGQLLEEEFNFTDPKELYSNFKKLLKAKDFSGAGAT